jgi:5-methylcytosine-specific restriction endonuclease McrA
MKPTPEEQLQFLQHIQRLFEDGDFVATYKFALLMSLAELAIELDSDDYGSLEVSLPQIAEKFAELYWPQTAPFSSGVTGTEPVVLAQNQGEQAAVVTALLGLRQQGAATIAQARMCSSWNATIQRIALVVRQMPVQYLQNFGGVLVPFLYDYPPPRGRLLLKPGVPFLLRMFHPLIQQLARAGWVRHVRHNQRNRSALGEVDGLEEFMFGSSRNALNAVGNLLSKLQSKRCFYCGSAISGGGEVDHFIPWSKYPRDLAHNFVLAHAECNRRKSDMLAAERHLATWLERNRMFGQDISAELGDSALIADLGCSCRVASWAYDQGLQSGAQGWLKAKETEPLTDSCRRLLNASIR